jgi:prevent-host-death family protein
MKQVTISEFRANLLKYLKIVQRGEQMNVTSKGAMLATLIPPVGQHDVAKEKLEKLAKTAEINDLVTPTDGSWNAMK